VASCSVVGSRLALGVLLQYTEVSCLLFPINGNGLSFERISVAMKAGCRDTAFMNDQQLERLALETRDYLLGRATTLAVAESCTGGWVAKLMTDIAGSSDWFDRGFVTYSNQAKQEMLGVSEVTLTQEGAVSQPTVEAMVRGVLKHSHADVAVAVSGIAGPGGGTEEKPVGTVWFAWMQKGGQPVSEQHLFAGDREQVRRQAVARLMVGILENLGEG